MSERRHWEQVYADMGTPWDLGGPCPALDEVTEAARLQGFRDGCTVAVPGCGLGHDAAWLAARGFQATGLDLVPEALDRARAVYGEPPAWRVGDWLAGAHGPFEAILDHTFFVALHPDQRPEVVANHARNLLPGGFWLGIFYHRVRQPGIRPWAVQPEELRALAEPFFEVLDLQSARTSHPRRLGRECWMVARRR